MKKAKFCFVCMTPEETKRELERNWRENIAPILKVLFEKVAKGELK